MVGADAMLASCPGPCGARALGKPPEGLVNRAPSADHVGVAAGARVRAARRALGMVSAGLALALFVLVPSGASSGAQFDPVATLMVDVGSGAGRSYALVSLASDGMAAVELSVPAGYELTSTSPVGARIGFAFGAVTDASNSLTGFLSSELRVDDPARYAGDVDAQRCAPGVHAAVWRAEFAALGRTIPFPIFVDPAPAGSTSTSAILRFCPSWPDVGIEGGLVAPLISFSIDDQISSPSAAGRYVWSALVQPTHPASSTGYPAGTFEMRAVVEQPTALTLTARYDAKAKMATLRGKVTSAGVPQRGVEVRLIASELSTDDIDFLDDVTTNAAGEFTLRHRVETSTRFQASADAKILSCSSPSSAPAGCVSETVTPPPSTAVTVKVRGARDAKLVPRRRDQALARRVNLARSDFPQGWDAISDTDPFFPCQGFDPDLSKLTVHAEAESPIFLSESAGGWSISSVYSSATQTKTAFDKLATLAAARCVAKELRGEGATVEVEPVSFSGVRGSLRAFRLVIKDSEVQGFLDYVWIRQGRTLVRVGFVSFAGLGDLPIEAEILAKVAARARNG